MCMFLCALDVCDLYMCMNDIVSTVISGALKFVHVCARFPVSFARVVNRKMMQDCIIRLAHTMGVSGEAFQLHTVYKKPYFVLQVTRESVSVLQVTCAASERAMKLKVRMINSLSP